MFPIHQVYGDEHNEVAVDMYNVARSLQTLHRPEEAAQLITRAQGIRAKGTTAVISSVQTEY